MADDFKSLRDLGACAKALAARPDWPKLYDVEKLRNTPVPIAALVSLIFNQILILGGPSNFVYLNSTVTSPLRATVLPAGEL